MLRECGIEDNRFALVAIMTSTTILIANGWCRDCNHIAEKTV
jgi:hypothetical protein